MKNWQLNRLRMRMERRVGAIGKRGGGAWCATGESFITFTMAVRPLGIVWVGFDSFKGYLKKIGYNPDGNFVLYWRTPPSYEAGNLYFRLVVSEKPALY